MGENGLKRKITAVVLLIVFLFSAVGCGGKNRRSVGRCAGYEILYEELRYMTLSVRDSLAERDGDGIWDAEESAEAHRDELEREVWARIAEDYAVLAAAARYLPDRSVDDKDIQSAVDADIAEMRESVGGKSEFRKYLSAVYMTEHLLRFRLAAAQIESELTDALAAGTELENADAFTAWLTDGNLVRVRQVTVAADSEAAAETVRAALLGGATPEQAAEAANALPNVSAAVTNAYYLVRGMAQDPTLEDDAFALRRTGDVSAVRQTEGGYRILVRAEDQTEAFLANQASAYLRRLRDLRISALLEETSASLSVERNDYGAGIDLLKIRP